MPQAKGGLPGDIPMRGATAQPLVMAAERTSWEKATAAHMYCLQGGLRGDRYSRHWYDLAALAKTTHFASAASDYELSRQVAGHKSMFFAEKDVDGGKVDYFQATSGGAPVNPAGAVTGRAGEGLRSHAGRWTAGF